MKPAFPHRFVKATFALTFSSFSAKVAPFSSSESLAIAYALTACWTRAESFSERPSAVPGRAKVHEKSAGHNVFSATRTYPVSLLLHPIYHPIYLSRRLAPMICVQGRGLQEIT